MTKKISSIVAAQHLPGSMTACSLANGWSSLLMRAYTDPPQVDEFTTPPTPDHLIVLVTSGACKIESYSGGHWKSARYGVGDIGMTAPGHSATLRWRGRTAHSTLQLHLPAETIWRVRAELSASQPREFEMPNALCYTDPVIKSVMLGLSEASRTGVPDLYAESAAEFLVAHLLVRHGGVPAPASVKPCGAPDRRLQRVEAFLRENLGAHLSLQSMARCAGLSRFHLLRLFKGTYGETPLKYLTRLRMDEAKRRIALGSGTVTEIALACGYDNPAHFASAFRRVVGVAPNAYRRQFR